MNNIIAAVLIAGAGLTATSALAENPGQFQKERIAAALAKADATPPKSTSTNPTAAVLDISSDAFNTLDKKRVPHSGKDRYAPPRGVHGDPDR